MSSINQGNSDPYSELSFYTLAHPDSAFIHQHIVDAFAAQMADQNTKPIKLAFALIGLYLYLVKNYSGREVQIAHMQLANKRKRWPLFLLPEHRGTITAADVVAVPPGDERDEMIQKWCASVWEAYRDSHQQIAELVHTALLD